ncbi:type II/IV secretion system protein [Pelomonas sp. SE-A7]|uniref:GspE/PulE family protein n=1 Tax=Pelomonas sp. SE-A7 TaxID=3054953 RepID=UPI00259D251A|nr:type II/IV secretion system protein [Pelomonas sp. SE-A7]MDM4767538.1 ATPase, T2SS/T4P/T4SS family [Pelomonas sp. SE-A7]
MAKDEAGMERRPRRLGELLLDRGLLRSSDLDAALGYQAAHGGRIGAVLLRMGAVTADSLYPVLAEQLGMPLLRGAQLDEAAVRAALAELGAPGQRLLAAGVLPWREADGRWQIVSADPLLADLRESVAALDSLEGADWQLMPEADLEQWSQRLARSELNLQSLDARALRELAEDAPVIALVNNLVAQAVEARASDIHLEPGEREFEVRLRIDGVLHLRQSLGMDRYPAVASRIKLIAGIDIAERRLPQDGRISMRAAGAEIDVRVSSIPAVYGESIVMRLLPKRRDDLSLERLGMRPTQLGMFKRWLGIPNGLVLVTGPTGSGKSTTLYSALAATNDQTRKIVTVEDPVEFRLPHVIQVQTQAEIGYTFARALRAFLRHDPDVIMVGEIRDRETAEIAIQSALTGHLVLATLHTNDAPAAITRLVDMGVEPFLVAASLRAVMAQRLVRRLCDACAQPTTAPAALSDRSLQLSLVDAGSDGLPVSELPRWRKPIGCPACEQTGFRGRVGIYEMLDLGPDLQHAIAQGEPIASIEAMANAQGRRSLAQEGVLKVVAGMSTLDEVLRATGGSLAD